MSTTLRVELTKVGCPVNTATIYLQNTVGSQNIIGKQDQSPANLGGRAVTNGVDPQLDKPFAIRQDGQFPRCIAYDSTGNFIYVWHVPATGNPGFRKVAMAAGANATYVTGNQIIPIFVL